MAKILAVSDDGTRFLISVGIGDALNARGVELARVLDIGTGHFIGDEPLPVDALTRIGYWHGPDSLVSQEAADVSALADSLL